MIIGRVIVYPTIKWFDFWVGVYYDKKKNIVYIFPVPTLGVVRNIVRRVKRREQNL